MSSGTALPISTSAAQGPVLPGRDWRLHGKIQGFNFMIKGKLSFVLKNPFLPRGERLKWPIQDPKYAPIRIIARWIHPKHYALLSSVWEDD